MNPASSTNLVFLSSQSPWSSSSARACLDAAMTAAVFDLPVTLVLHHDGVLQLLKQQDGSVLGLPTLANMFGALGLYGFSHIYIDEQSLTQRGLVQADLLQLDDAQYAEVPLQLNCIDADALSELIANSKAVFNF